MEATGVYWKPVWHILSDGDVELVLANAAHVKNVPGRKTDVNDATWLAELLAHGLVRGSFVPDEQTQEMRTTFDVGRRFRCTMRVDCGQLDPGAVIRPAPGEWQSAHARAARRGGVCGLARRPQCGLSARRARNRRAPAVADA